MKHSKHPGFTLIEVMVVVAIVALLTTIALPSYQEYVRRGQVTEAMTSLSDFRIKMEQYYQDNRSYGSGNCADGTNAPGWNTFVRPDTRYFDFTCTLTQSGQGYRLTATGARQQALGHVYRLNQNNERETVTFKNSGSGKPCWLVKGDEC